VRLIYILLMYLLAPVAVAVSLWRSLKDRSYLDRLGERFGYSRHVFDVPTIWVHAVSVGEVQAAAALIRELRKRHPDVPLIVTTVTPTGAQRVASLFGADVHHVYMPYDLPGAVNRFLERIRPQIAIILETELWPNLFHACGRRQIPLVLASARISPRSVTRYRRLVSLFTETLSHGIVIAAQTEADAERFRSIGANPARTHVTGNIKFDFEIPDGTRVQGAAFRREHIGSRPVWIAGSTHEGEEEAALEAHAAVRREQAAALLIVVPRHPNRFEAVRTLLARRGMAYASRSREGVPRPADSVFLVDTLGELMLFYAASDVAFVAGSLVPVGGHNMLEPAALGLPILSGPYTFNAEDIAQMFFSAGAARKVDDAAGLGAAVLAYFEDPERRRTDGCAGREIVAANRGALGRLLALIEPLLADVGSGAGRDQPARLSRARR
jgi:3-deoxy-D-manno-octulosonic-acid transferase